MAIGKATSRRLLFWGGFILFGYFFCHSVTSPKLYIEEIKSSYKGIIVQKYFLKTTHLKIKTLDQGEIDIAALSGDLLKEGEVGDSIEKIPNDNYVFLSKNGARSKLIYIYIPDLIRNDSRWPAEWKDKWREER